MLAGNESQMCSIVSLHCDVRPASALSMWPMASAGPAACVAGCEASGGGPQARDISAPGGGVRWVAVVVTLIWVLTHRKLKSILNQIKAILNQCYTMLIHLLMFVTF